MKFYHEITAAFAHLGLECPPELLRVTQHYPFLTTEYYLNLVDPANWRHDPIARQIFPDPRELDDAAGDPDAMAENAQSPLPFLIHRYPDRVLLLTTSHCALRCRFCFRKRLWSRESDWQEPLEQQLPAVLAYLNSHPGVREVLISGGDPLLLPRPRLEHILDTLRQARHVQTLRLASRVPVVWPQRIDAALAARLGDTPGLWLATHFNHPRELTAESAAACRLLVRHGVPVINQTVLLKGVNDDADTLAELFRALVALRVKPHYLFHLDPVRGVGHFATGLACGLDILRRFRATLSSLAVPTFALDLPEGGGKVALQPDYRCPDGYPDLQGKRLIPYPDHPLPETRP